MFRIYTGILTRCTFIFDTHNYAMPLIIDKQRTYNYKSRVSFFRQYNTNAGKFRICENNDCK